MSEENKPSEQKTAEGCLDWIITRYHDHWQIMGFSPYAWPAQATNLRQFLRFLEAEHIAAIEAVQRETLMQFQRWLYYTPSRHGTARAAATINRALGAVKSLFRFLHQEGCIAYDPAAELEYMREPQRLPRDVLTPAEARKVIETPDTGTLIGYRDRAILEVLYATGIRKRELMNLTVEDVDLEGELLRINGGKGAKDRVVPLSGIACSFLESYIKAVRPRLLRGRQSRGLFISLESAPMGRTTIDQMVEKYARLSGVKKKITPHVWRHTCATHLVRNRANLRHVQEMLGHKALTTTERYLHLTIADLKEAHRKFHPRERGSGK
jgi:integrase/recombinase XerD